MKEQIGIAAMLKKIQENLPFWTEKLPEMPDLLHDSLKQLKTLPELQQRQFEQQLKLQQRQHRSNLAMGVGSTFLVLAALLPLHTNHWWPSLTMVALAAPCWFYAFKPSRKE
jgi:ubiquinone biosynthesis protein